MTIRNQDITREPLGRLEARFLAKMGMRPTFSTEDARQALGHQAADPTRFMNVASDECERRMWTWSNWSDLSPVRDATP